MTVSNLPIFPQTFTSISVANTAGANTQNVVQGGVNGTKVDSIVIASTDTIDHALLFSMNVSGTLTALANVNIPANSGNLITLPVTLFANNEFSPWLISDAAGNKYLLLANSSCSLVCASNSVNSSGKVVAVSGFAENY